MFQSSSSFYQQFTAEHIWKLILHLHGTAPSVLINCYSICLITRHIVPYFPALFFPTSIHFDPPGPSEINVAKPESACTPSPSLVHPITSGWSK